MDPCELRNTLPQAEDRWAAGSAQSWAGFRPGPGKCFQDLLLHLSIDI